MKIIQSIIGLFLLLTLNLLGDIKFNFIYDDEPGTGFHTRPKAKADLEKVGQLIGSNWLKHHNANIVIKVLSEENDSQTYLASAISVSYLDRIKNGFHHSYLGKKILLGEQNEDKEFDAILKVNFRHSYGFGDKIKSHQFDFKAVLIHEITHLLGFASSSKCPASNEELLDDNLDDFINKLFIYGINATQRKVDSKVFHKLVKKLKFLKSTDIDINSYILEHAYSPLEKLKMNLVLKFKRALEKGSSIKVRSKLLNKFSNKLSQKGMSIQSFIKFEKDTELFMLEMAQEVQKLLNNTSDPLKEKKLREILLTFDFLHDGFNDYVMHNYERLIKRHPELKRVFSCLQAILIFYGQYLTTGTTDDAVERIKNIISLKLDPLGLSLEELCHSLTSANSVKSHTFFDQFIISENGKKFFDKKVDKKYIKACLLEDGESGKQLYFSGPNTLKYIGFEIPLYGMDASHTLDMTSIMSPSLNLGLQSLEWDDQVTAIMLDLGYNVDNYWTRLWNYKKSKTKKSAKKKRSRKAKNSDKKSDIRH